MNRVLVLTRGSVDNDSEVRAIADEAVTPTEWGWRLWRAVTCFELNNLEKCPCASSDLATVLAAYTELRFMYSCLAAASDTSGKLF